MSRAAEILAGLYRDGKVTIDGLRRAVRDSVINEAEFEDITGEVYI